MDSTKALWEQIEKIGRNPEPLPIMCDPDIAWDALEDVSGDGPGVECAAFMFVGISSDNRFFMFKHINTRRYIYVPIQRG